MSNEIQPTNTPNLAVPVECATPTRVFAYKRLVDLPQSTPFPKNVFSFREYNSWKVFALIVFASALFSLGRAFLAPITSPGDFTGPAREHYENRGVIKRGWDAFYGWAWQRTPPETKIKESAEKQIAWGRWCASVAARASARRFSQSSRVNGAGR